MPTIPLWIFNDSAARLRSTIYPGTPGAKEARVNTPPHLKVKLHACGFIFKKHHG
jgi:hypothetical protein